MMKPVSIQQRIRILGARGVSWREIARRLGVSRDTVRKYATMEDCSPKPAAGKGRRSLIDACSGTVDSWLSADRLMPRKQRHTARRVYARLVEEEGFEGSYSSVRRYVRRWREEHRSDGDGYLELDWGAGVMQVDFGEAVATIGGNDARIHCLVATFPHSNMRYVAATPGENAECVCEGLAQILDHIGMVPRVLVLDNATGAGLRVAWNKVTVVRVFAMFCDHYRLETRSCNPYSGNEKGSVENAVGFLRRNLMAPSPTRRATDS
ncbi:IS21 family transposase [Bifidobacterium breve]|uniref:IS21 family transposase n=1 Tax=Bifidobacterium breve TaxID=1685 RepID=UPI00080BFB06|nr:IS21 family transposase [Bifidobacterium breve]